MPFQKGIYFLENWQNSKLSYLWQFKNRLAWEWTGTP